MGTCQMGFEYGQCFRLECPGAFLIAPAPPANSQFPQTAALKKQPPSRKIRCVRPHRMSKCLLGSPANMATTSDLANRHSIHKRLRPSRPRLSDLPKVLLKMKGLRRLDSQVALTRQWDLRAMIQGKRKWAGSATCTAQR